MTKTKIFLLVASVIVVICSLQLACTKPQDETRKGSSVLKPERTVMDACAQYKASRDCEAKFLKRVPPSIKCETLVQKFEPPACSQADINYTYEAFKQDAQRMCAPNLTKEQYDAFKTAFDKNRVSRSCIKLTEE